jgi:hypothetical protein
MDKSASSLKAPSAMTSKKGSVAEIPTAKLDPSEKDPSVHEPSVHEKE